MLQLLNLPLGTLFVAFAAIATFILYYFAKVKDTEGKQLPQVRGFKPYLQFFQRALVNDLHGWSLQWTKKYGDIFNMNILGRNIVFINNSEIVRRILNAPEYKDYSNDRPYTFIGRYCLYGDNSVAFNSSSPLQQQRRKAFHNSLKFYGDGVGSAESVILRVLNEEVDKFRNERVVEISKDISRIILRIVDHLFVGYKPEGADKRVKCLYEFDVAFNKLFIYGNEAFLQPFPFLRFVPGRFKRLYDEFVRVRTNCEEIYFAKRDSLIVDKDGGLMGQLLRLQKEHGTHIFPEETIKSILLEATVASYLTTSSMVSTVVILCILYPDLQARLYDEIERVIGDETPCLRRHRNKMPIMDSFILETLRYSSSAPFLLLHALSKDVTLDGYHIPKDAILIMNAWYAQRHPSVWEDPWTFKADRFLDENGDLLPANHRLRLHTIPFGTGRRACPGEAFAKSRMFLLIVTLFQNFVFMKAPGCELPDIDPRTWVPGAVVGPRYFKCAIYPRKKTNDLVAKEE